MRGKIKVSEITTQWDSDRLGNWDEKINGFESAVSTSDKTSNSPLNYFIFFIDLQHFLFYPEFMVCVHDSRRRSFWLFTVIYILVSIYVSFILFTTSLLNKNKNTLLEKKKYFKS